jgi:di/tricarboxylate transporter
MKSTDEELDEEIDKLLAEWQDTVETPSTFQREVWRRVELAGPCKHSLFERIAWWLLRPMREVVILALVVLVALIWGLTHPPLPDHSPHDAYLLSISPFDPHHFDPNSR